MATVKGPLLSIQAHGAIAGTILYRHINGRDVVSLNQSKPKTSSPARDVQESLMRCARIQWRSLTVEQRDVWNQLAATTPNLSGYNIYIREWLLSHRFGVIPIFGCAVFGWATFASCNSPWGSAVYDTLFFDGKYFE